VELQIKPDGIMALVSRNRNRKKGSGCWKEVQLGEDIGDE
jgi:hypothetical protein